MDPCSEDRPDDSTPGAGFLSTFEMMTMSISNGMERYSRINRSRWRSLEVP